MRLFSAPSHSDPLTVMVRDLFNARSNGQCAYGISDFLTLAAQHHAARNDNHLNGLGFGDLTYLFTTSKTPHLALIVSYNDAFIKEFRAICDRLNNGTSRANHLAPRVLTERKFGKKPRDHSKKPLLLTEKMPPVGSALLITDFSKLDLNEIRKTGIVIVNAIPKAPYKDKPMSESYIPVARNDFYEVLATTLLSATPSPKSYGRAIAEHILRRKPNLIAA